MTLRKLAGITLLVITLVWAILLKLCNDSVVVWALSMYGLTITGGIGLRLLIRKGRTCEITSSDTCC